MAKPPIADNVMANIRNLADRGDYVSKALVQLLDRMPTKSYTRATRPANSNDFLQGSMIFLEDEEKWHIADGQGNWRNPDGKLT